MSSYDPKTDPPGAVSNQNGEEGESRHREDHTHPEPRTREHPIPLAPGEEPAVNGSGAEPHDESHEDEEPEHDPGS